MDLLNLSRDQIPLCSLNGTLIRIVENQEQVATNALVDNLQEQALLEELLESNKPQNKVSSTHLHYLLATPFRYPPLKYGSRFGSRQEPSLFYASLKLGTALCETAYYRFVFWSGMTTPPASAKLTTEHSSLSVRYATNQGTQLQFPPFDAYRSTLTDTVNYTTTQKLGNVMRDAGIEAFEYPSARDPEKGNNIALFTPHAFRDRRPVSTQNWICETTADMVSFYNPQKGAYQFELSTFLVDNILPAPAL